MVWCLCGSRLITLLFLSLIVRRLRSTWPLLFAAPYPKTPTRTCYVERKSIPNDVLFPEKPRDIKIRQSKSHRKPALGQPCFLSPTPMLALLLTAQDDLAFQRYPSSIIGSHTLVKSILSTNSGAKPSF
ncbi:hypothetical protein BDW69DRAFT_52166 [Aspergillus filifer]